MIAGAAGLTMGRGLVFPGTLSRMKAFPVFRPPRIEDHAEPGSHIYRRGPHRRIPDEAYGTAGCDPGLFIFSCFAIIVFYYVWYPIRKARRGFRIGEIDPMLSPDGDAGPDFRRIQSGGELFSMTFALFRRDFGKIATRAALAALAFCLVVFPFAGKEPATLFVFTWEFMGMLKAIPDFIRNPGIPWLPALQIPLFAWLILEFFRMIRVEAQSHVEAPGPKQRTLLEWLKTAIGAALLVLLLLAKEWYTILAFALLAPMAMVWVHIMLWEGKSALQAISRLFEIVFSQLGRYFGFVLLLAAVGYLFFLLLDSTVLWLTFDSLGIGFSLEQSLMDNLVTIWLVSWMLFLLFVFLGAMIYGSVLLYHTLAEIQDASHLRSRIGEVGLQRRFEGIPREE